MKHEKSCASDHPIPGACDCGANETNKVSEGLSNEIMELVQKLDCAHKEVLRLTESQRAKQMKIKLMKCVQDLNDEALSSDDNGNEERAIGYQRSAEFIKKRFQL